MFSFHQTAKLRSSRLWDTIWTIALCSSLILIASVAQGNNHHSPASSPQAQSSADPGADQAPDPQVKNVLDKLAAAGVLHMSTVQDVRKAFLFYPTLSGKPENVFRVEDKQIPGPAGQVPIRLYFPQAGRGLPIFVFFHIGGFVAGDLNTDDVPLRAIANRCGCIVLSVAYRLAPENPYPAAPNDCYAATKWAAEHANEFGGDARRIAVGGDGAGGNLAAVVALMGRDRGGSAIIFQVLVYPTLDADSTRASRYLSHDPSLTPDIQAEILGAYLPMISNPKDPYISPVYATSAKNLPSMLLVTDEDDPTRDEGNAYADKLADAGVKVQILRYPNMIHGFFTMTGDLDAARKAVAEISQALKVAFQTAQTPK